jgi:undecaprenyl-diphosphatase
LRSLVVASDQFSFPSGHSSGAFLLATCLAIVYGGPVTAMYLWATGVAVSRVILGVHFPGDTLAGAVMGTSITVFSASQLGLL